MHFNWLDVILIVILLLTFIMGLVKGLIRQVLGLAGVIVGLILASRNYSWLSWKLHSSVKSDFWRNCLSFLLIFIFIVLLSWLLGILLGKLMKGPLSLVNHLMGAALGLLKGLLICAVIVMAMVVFDFQQQALISSKLTPACLRVSNAMISLIPDDLKAKFNDNWRKFQGKGGGIDEQKIR
ncbi:MAG TPA: CvpA family protein [Candidatus Saccharicenans sp.]|jgi:membrane protein required for colicin V production|nr:CvpA family protein [Candidatus Saccharicenans sp.]HRD01854.1 CvpA family protein [Candidatus Saccharicenans sp.]